MCLPPALPRPEYRTVHDASNLGCTHATQSAIVFGRTQPDYTSYQIVWNRVLERLGLSPTLEKNAIVRRALMEVRLTWPR